MRIILGIGLLPFCAAASMTMVQLVRTIPAPADALIPPSGMALSAGFFLWLLIFVLLPRPTLAYVLAHELTHALWALLMREKVFKLKVAPEKGSITVSNENFLITLAPYFFPLYTLLIIGLYYFASIFWEVERYELYWLGLIGFSWAFHLTFTIGALLRRQSDVLRYGRIFSYALIYLFNIIGLCLWIVLVSAPTLEQFADTFRFNIAVVAVWIWDHFCAVFWSFAGNNPGVASLYG